MVGEEEVKTVIKILEALIYELDTYCNDVCTSNNCIDCSVPYVRDKLVDVIRLLGGE